MRLLGGGPVAQRLDERVGRRIAELKLRGAHEEGLRLKLARIRPGDLQHRLLRLLHRRCVVRSVGRLRSLVRALSRRPHAQRGRQRLRRLLRVVLLPAAEVAKVGRVVKLRLAHDGGHGGGGLLQRLHRSRVVGGQSAVVLTLDGGADTQRL